MSDSASSEVSHMDAPAPSPLFKEGDRVRVAHDRWTDYPRGTEGTVILAEEGRDIYVRPDNFPHLKSHWIDVYHSPPDPGIELVPGGK